MRPFCHYYNWKVGCSTWQVVEREREREREYGPIAPIESIAMTFQYLLMECFALSATVVRYSILTILYLVKKPVSA